MNRLGLLSPGSLDPKQKELYDQFSDYVDSHYGDRFVTKLDDGRFFAVQLHTPEVGKHFLGFAAGMRQIPGLSPSGREIAILVVGSHTQAAYEIAAHEKLSGLPRADLDEIANGVCPSSLDDEGKTVFKLANELFKPGPLSDETWNEATRVLGVSGTTAVVQYVGFYKYVATILNGFDVKVPAGRTLEE